MDRPGAGVAASPPPRRRNPDHPPYVVMVQEALRALADNDGSTEAAISRYIISAYPGIPPGHPRLLPYYLSKLVTTRELHFSPSGRYLLPDSRPREFIAPPPPVPKPNAPPCRKSSLVLRLRKTISGDGSGRKVSWCYVGDGSTSSPSVTDQQSGSVAKRPGGESHPPVPAISGLGPQSPSLVSDPYMEGISLTLGGLDEPKESLTVGSPINVGSESRKQDGESGSDAKKAGGESHPSVSTSKQAEPLLPPAPSPVSGPNMEGISPTLGLVESNHLLAVQSSVDEQQLGSEDAESHPPVPVSMQLEPEEALLVPSSPHLLDSNLECTSLNKPKEALLAPIPQSGSESVKQDGPPTSVSMQAEPEKEPLQPPPILDRNLEWTAITISGLGLDEPKESLTFPSPINVGSESRKQDGAPGSDAKKTGGESHPSVSTSKQAEPLFPPAPSPVSDPNMEGISPTLGLVEPNELLAVQSSVDEQQLGGDDAESHPPVPVSMQLEPEEAMLAPSSPHLLDSNLECTSLNKPKEASLAPIPQSGSESVKQDGRPTSVSMQAEPEKEPLQPPPVVDRNMEWTSPVLRLDELKESSPVSPCITDLPTTSSIHTKLENPQLLPPVSDPNMEWASQSFGLNELKASSLVSRLIANQQSGSDPDSMQADSEKVLSLPLPPSPPVLVQLQSEPDPHLPKKTSSPASLIPEPNRVWSLLALDELKESLPVSTAIANQQSGTESSKKSTDSHPPNSALMQQTDPGKELPPPPISVQLQAESEPKLSSPDRVLEKPSLALGEKKSLSRKPRPKQRRRL